MVSEVKGVRFDLKRCVLALKRVALLTDRKQLDGFEQMRLLAIRFKRNFPGAYVRGR